MVRQGEFSLVQLAHLHLLVYKCRNLCQLHLSHLAVQLHDAYWHRWERFYTVAFAFLFFNS